MLDELIALVETEVYYVADELCPRADEEGQPVVFGVQLPLSEERFCVLHPDHLPKMQEAAARVNVRLVSMEQWPCLEQPRPPSGDKGLSDETNAVRFELQSEIHKLNQRSKNGR